MKIIRRITETTIVILFIILISAVLIQVISRYVFNNPPSWTEELARYCQVWLIILTSSICIKKGNHLAVDYLSHKFSIKTNRIIKFTISILIVMYLCVVVVFGIRLVAVGDYQVSPAMQIKMSYIYLIFPIGGFIMLLEAVINSISLLKVEK